MTRKSQAMIFENVLIFTAGVAIFILCYAVFMVYQGYFTTLGVEDQLGAVNEYVKSHIILLAEKDANSSVVFNLPKEVSNEHYTVELTPEGVNVTSLASRISRFSTLSLDVELEPKKVPSMRARITLKKKGNKIIMRT